MPMMTRAVASTTTTPTSRARAPGATTKSTTRAPTRWRRPSSRTIVARAGGCARGNDWDVHKCVIHRRDARPRRRSTARERTADDRQVGTMPMDD